MGRGRGLVRSESLLLFAEDPVLGTLGIQLERTLALEFSDASPCAPFTQDPSGGCERLWLAGIPSRCPTVVLPGQESNRVTQV